MTPPPVVVSCFSHLGLTVSDLRASVDFYTEVLGFVPLYTDEEEGWARVGLAVGDVLLELFSSRSDPAPRPYVDPFYPAEFGRPKIALTVVDVVGTYGRVVATGITPLCEITTTRVSKFFFVSDPDGTPIQLHEFTDERQRLTELFE